MTAYATRSPLQLVTNTHYVMGDRRSTRRTSARLMEQEDARQLNGVDSGLEKAKTNGASNRTAKAANSGGAKGKRKLDYDEEDDGFMFSRTRSKRTKAVQAPKVPAPIEEGQEEDTKPLPTRKPRKRSVEPGASTQVENENVAPRRRSTRNSADKSSIEPVYLEAPKRKQKASTAARTKRMKDAGEADEDQMELVGARAQTPVQAPEVASDTTKIALPFADTPIIRRNKEMRKGERRSSLGMRGRRASSLIDSGTSNALPHSEVESAEFYKHIESGLPEPRRMRQLLTWCGTRAMGDKPSFATEDSHAKLAAREIQQQLLADFSNKSELSDWFNREDAPSKSKPLKPNPKNIANASKVEELERHLAKLQTERQTWEGCLKPPPDPFSIPPLPESIPSHEEVNSTRLDKSDTDALSSFEGVPTSTTDPVSHQANIRARLKLITDTVEFETDKLANSVHILQQHLKGAEQLGDAVLAACAKVLEQRDREAAHRQEGDSVGTRDMLRALSRTLER